MPFLQTFDLRGGRRGAEAPDTLSENQCQDAVNVDWYRTRFARRRNGSASAGFTSQTFTSTVLALFRHTPNADETGAELWASDGNTVKRVTAGTAFTAVTFQFPGTNDQFTPNPMFYSAASLNGYFFLAYNDALDTATRLNVWDPVMGKVRRAGLPAPTAPTVADSGAGAYPAIARFYRVRWTEQQGGITVRRSEPSASVAFTPSGAGLVARVTRPTTAGEGETHWEIEASTDNINFYQIGLQVIGLTILDDGPSGGTGISVSQYATKPLSAVTGTYSLHQGYLFLAADQNRLLGFGRNGDNPNAPKHNRVVFSAIVGSLNVGDAERVDQTTGYYVDLDEKDSSRATGLAGPVNGSFFAFKEKETWMLTPTTNVLQPYTAKAISKTVGAVANAAIVRAEDEQGNPALYWLSRRGVYRYGIYGLQSIGEGVEDLILGPTSTISQASLYPVAGVQPAHGVYYQDLRQLWFWFATGNNTSADTLIVYTLGRDGSPSGWSRYTGSMANAACSVMFANTPGALMSRDLKPYIGQAGAVNRIWKCGVGNQDGDSTNYQAYVRTRTLRPWGFESQGELNRAYLLANALAGVNITQTITPDYGADTPRSTVVSLAPSGSETEVRKRYEDSGAQDIGAFDLTIGDAAAGNIAQWTLVGHSIEYSPEEIR